MNRAEMTRGIVACETLAKELRAALTADARGESEEQGTAPTWRLPGLTVSSAMSSDSVAVVDEAAFTAWVAKAYPTEIETVTAVRPAFRAKLLGDAAGRGEPVCAEDGEVIPGVEFRPGGEFRAVSVRPTSALRSQLAAKALDIVEGRAPLALPIGGGDE